MGHDAESLIRRYFAAFNAKDSGGMLACVSASVCHDVNQGARREGVELFRDFLAHMNRCYDEQVLDLVVMAAPDGKRASAEFVIEGRYVSTDTGLPKAKGQTYRLACGSFFEVADGRISRVTTYYNLADWLKQIEAQ